MLPLDSFGVNVVLKVSTKERALREGKELLQRQGYNGFSFQHVANALKIKKPSLFAHFKSKEDLGLQIIETYRRDFLTWTETISEFEPRAKVGALFEIFFKFSQHAGRLCPLSALISDYHTLPRALQRGVENMFQVQAEWLNEVIKQGQKTKAFDCTHRSQELTEAVMAIGLGAQLMARIAGKPVTIRQLKEQVLGLLEG